MNFNVGLMSLVISCAMLSYPIAAMENQDDTTASGFPYEPTLVEKARDFFGLTPDKKLFRALYALNISEIEECLQGEASLTAKNDNNETPEAWARKNHLPLLADALANFNEEFGNKDALIEEANKFRRKRISKRFNDSGFWH